MKEIASALVRAQKAFGPALKSSTNPHFRTRYADLSACIEAVIDGLNSNGIAMIQKTFEHTEGVVVETVFVHESGEMLEGGRLFVPASKVDAQGFGSALTYARRYSLMAACGISPEDDDGHAATKAPRQAAPAPKPASKPAAKAPESMEGRDGPWQLKVTADKDVSPSDWGLLVVDAAKIALENAGSQEDVMNIFKVNRNIFDRMKVDTPALYDDVMEQFKEAKAKYKKD
jgi:hypothetical protein